MEKRDDLKILSLFQFLIGRLGTHTGLPLFWVVELFQFLIGRLGTVIVEQDRVTVYFVSIPHR